MIPGSPLFVHQANSYPRCFNVNTNNADQLRQSLKYEADSTIENVLDDLGNFRDLDKLYEKKWKTSAAIGFLGVVVLFFSTLYADASSFSITASSLMFIGATMAIAGVILAIQNRTLDLPDRRYEVAHGLLSLLSKDMPPNAPLAIALEFKPHDHRTKFVREGRVGRWTVKYYVDPWLKVRGRLADGTKFSVSMIEKIQRRRCQKVSASGKTKHKTKNKISSEAIVSLAFKINRYPEASKAYQQAPQCIQLPAWAMIKSVKTNHNILTVRSTTDVKWSANRPGRSRAKLDGVNWLAMMFLSLYRLLHISRK
jgi:hypothetical protein